MLIYKGATTAEKLRGQGLDPNTGALTPCAQPKAGMGVGAGGCRHIPLWGPGCQPRKIFENSYAKSCILVVSALISGRHSPSVDYCWPLGMYFFSSKYAVR